MRDKVGRVGKRAACSSKWQALCLTCMLVFKHLILTICLIRRRVLVTGSENGVALERACFVAAKKQAPMSFYDLDRMQEALNDIECAAKKQIEPTPWVLDIMTDEWWDHSIILGVKRRGWENAVVPLLSLSRPPEIGCMSHYKSIAEYERKCMIRYSCLSGE
jgi:hypothetical protein